MMDKDKELLVALELRMRQLMLYCDSLKEENDSLKKEVRQKEEEIGHLTKVVDNLKLDYSNLKFAKLLASPNGGEREEAKKRLLKLVRDVDKCISMLKG